MSAVGVRWLACPLAALALVSSARAELITQSKSIDLTGSASTLDSIVFAPFDTSLGELNEAMFWAQLNLVYTIGTVPISSPTGAPMTTLVSSNASVQIQGITWPFDFQADCALQTTIISGSQIVLPVSVDIAWHSNGTSDLFGFTAGGGGASPCTYDPVNPVTLSDYLPTLLTSAVGLMTDVRSIFTVSSSVAPAAGSVAGGGMLQLQYDYTPAAMSVPEPTGLSLFGLGLTGLAFMRRKQRLPRG